MYNLIIRYSIETVQTLTLQVCALNKQISSTFPK